ncbi:MAG: helix-turn-helix domain-containing protein [Eubacteriaceae bacterium]
MKNYFTYFSSKKLTKSELQQKTCFSGNIITRLKRNNYISLGSLESTGKVMQHNVDDILEFEKSNDHN